MQHAGMEVRIGELVARCSACGGTQWNPVQSGDASMLALLACAGCGARITRGELVLQISSEAIKSAQEFVKSGKDRK
jgi:hypothetical protein